MNRLPDCPKLQWLVRMIDGKVSAQQEALLVSHLDNCASCQQRLVELENEQLRSELRRSSFDESKIKLRAFESTLAELRSERPRDAEASRLTPYADVVPWLGPSECGIGTLREFELMRFIGRGGMGLVFEAMDTKLQRSVAIKLMSPGLLADVAASERFLREARSAAKINHDNVVTVHAVDQIRGLPYLVMELIHGPSVADQLNRTTNIPFQDILNFVRQMALGLAAAHEKGVIHRDIKPSNLMLDAHSKRVKIADFGLASTVNDVSLTRSGLMAGTPDFTSPEQASAQPVDARSDLFSLGSVLFLLCVGRRPFESPSLIKTLDSVRNRAVERVDRLNGTIPGHFADIVERLLQKRPEDRIQSAHDLYHEVSRITWSASRNTEESRLASVGVSRSVPTSWIAIAGFLLVLGLIVGFLGLHPFRGHRIAVTDSVVVSAVDSTTHDTKNSQTVVSESEEPSRATNGDSEIGSLQVDTSQELLEALQRPGPLQLRLAPGRVFRLSSPVQIVGRSVRVESEPENRAIVELDFFQDSPSVLIENGSFMLLGIQLQDTKRARAEEAPIYCEGGSFHLVDSIVTCSERSTFFIGNESELSLDSTVVVAQETAFSLRASRAQSLEVNASIIAARANFAFEGHIDLNIKATESCFVGKHLFLLQSDWPLEHVSAKITADNTQFLSPSSLFELSLPSDERPFIVGETFGKSLRLECTQCSFPEQLLRYHRKTGVESFSWTAAEARPDAQFRSHFTPIRLQSLIDRIRNAELKSVRDVRSMTESK